MGFADALCLVFPNRRWRGDSAPPETNTLRRITGCVLAGLGLRLAMSERQ